MIDGLNSHLTDETLNEYLDDALGASPRSAVAAHLAGCAACSARLGALGALFAGLEALPAAPLKRDLRSGVMAAVRARRPAALRSSADPRRPPLQVVFALQTLLALALLAFAWPFLAGLALPVPAAADDLSGLVARLAGARLDPTGLWTIVQGWLATVIVQPALPQLTFFQPTNAGLLLIAAGMFWLLGNALLLRRSQRPAARLRRNS